MSSMMVAEALILLMLVGQPSGSDDERKAEAGRLLERGNKALEEGDAEGALAAYTAAYDAYPSPKIFFNMAEANRELGELVTAAELYERVVAEVTSSPLVGVAHERLAELDTQLGKLSVSTDPQGALILIDGKEAGTAPLSDVRVVAGWIEVTATFQGQRATETIQVPAGESRSLRLALNEGIALPPPPPPPPPNGEEGDDSIVSKWWFWTIIGVGVVAAGTTAAVVATSGNGFVPGGELERTNLDQWSRR